MSKLTNKEMLEQLIQSTNAINLKIDSIEARVSKLENPTQPKIATKGSKGNKKQVKKQTWSEKKAEYAKQFTKAERKAYGEEKQLARKNQRLAYEKTNKFFEKKGYVGKAVWRKKYNEILATL